MTRQDALAGRSITFDWPVEIHIVVSAEQYEALAEIAATLPLPDGDKSVQLALDALIADWRTWHTPDGAAIEEAPTETGGAP